MNVDMTRLAPRLTVIWALAISYIERTFVSCFEHSWLTPEGIRSGRVYVSKVDLGMLYCQHMKFFLFPNHGHKHTDEG